MNAECCENAGLALKVLKASQGVQSGTLVEVHGGKAPKKIWSLSMYNENFALKMDGYPKWGRGLSLK